MPDAFGRGIQDWYDDAMDAPLIYRDGEETQDHPIEDFYFGDFPDGEYGTWLESHLRGPLVDLGAGVGRDTLHFQDQFEAVAIEVSEALIEVMIDRGVEDGRLGDMFALREQFEAGRFQSALAIGTQTCLAGSMQGLRTFLADLAYVTTPDATAVVDSYDPTVGEVSELMGYREDPARGLAHRVAWFEYGDIVDPVLYFRLFSPDRLRAAAAATGWEVVDVRRPHGPIGYKAALEKR